MKKAIRTMLCGAVLLACFLAAEGTRAEDETVYWVNPSGGRYYHLDPNCPTINPRYLPLPRSMTKEELEQPENSFYMPCNVCLDDEYVPPGERGATETPAEAPAGDGITDPQSSEYAPTEREVTENRIDGKALLEEILSSYSGGNAVLSRQVQIVHSAVNFRESPGGKVKASLQGGEILECLDEEQYRGELWYHARSEQYGDGYVTGTYAKPIWNDQKYWPPSESEDTVAVSDNMYLFAYWMGTCQLDHGLSVIEGTGTDRTLNIAPTSVRGNPSVIPEGMKTELALKLYEFGMICVNGDYDRLRDESLPPETREKIASDVLWKHYGTDDIWEIITGQSLVLFLPVNDLHQPGVLLSERDRILNHALLEKLIREH